MANYFNIFAGVMTFIGSSALAYGLWTPTNNILSFFPTELYILCASSWMFVLFVCIAYMPFTMIVSDDYGG